MNISSYEVVNVEIDKTKTWIDPKHKALYSREIKNRKYATFARRWNPAEDEYSYYLILTDDNIDKRNRLRKEFDVYGRLRISLFPIWKDIPLRVINKAVNINIEVNDEQRDGTVYKLII